MDAIVKAKWTAALRSGEFEQGVGSLKTLDGKYCCLGVLAEVAGFEFGEKDTPCCSAGNYIVKDGKECGYRPFEALGLAPWSQARLWEMNDVYCKTFPEIADYIDANL